MRTTLQNWINDAEKVRLLNHLSISQIPISLAGINNRLEDYYISLVGQLFDAIKEPQTTQADWAQLGNSFLHFALDTNDQLLSQKGISKQDATLLAACAFYYGNYPASACLAIRRGGISQDASELHKACYDFLARQNITSEITITIREILRSGNLGDFDELSTELGNWEEQALVEGPEEWIRAKLLNRLLNSFKETNLRSVLPNGDSHFWDLFINSLINRQPSSWEFFPSQIQAIKGGLLTSQASYSLQMPTGAGKTTLCETLLYWHLKDQPDNLAVMLVPYRSLASELRNSLVKQLNSFGIASRCAYGGTVPTGAEIHELINTQLLVATPESLSGLLSAEPDFARRISLAICDEGHLLDGEGRGIGLELLLARLKGRPSGSTRFVFISAIVPNIEEINTWLGGTNETVIKSTYRPSIAEFSVLKTTGSGVQMQVDLDMHPHEPIEMQFSVEHFLHSNDFKFLNPQTNRINTFAFDSKKTLSIAAARKLLPMGAVAIFAMNKRGDQGAIGIAESLIEQLEKNLSLPKPSEFANSNNLNSVVAYLTSEFGATWIGTRCLQNGAVLHHGDLPQETREILEKVLRDSDSKLVICTSTLAEGVNLPIRTIVLYSIQRWVSGRTQSMLARDIKNLVGRAGRAGANTKGLVICSDRSQWSHVEAVATQMAGEPVNGSLVKLINAISNYLASNRNASLNNEFLEEYSEIHPLIDGVDSTLIELMSDEVGEDVFINQAVTIANHTFASSQLSPQSNEHLRSVFALRAQKIISLRTSGKSGWAKQTGAKIRFIESVENSLLPSIANWSEDMDPLSNAVLEPILNWAWTHTELVEQIKRSYNLGEDDEILDAHKDQFFAIVRLWLEGKRFFEISQNLNVPVDDLLAIHTQALTFGLQTLVEQGISLVAKNLESRGIVISETFVNLPEFLRYGVSNSTAKFLASIGVRHRHAYNSLAAALLQQNFQGDQNEIRELLLNGLNQVGNQWRAHLGVLIYQNTLSDLSS